MKTRLLSGLLAFFLLLLPGLSGTVARAAANLAITATNATMPRTGNGQSQFTITGIPEAGEVVVGCTSAGPVDPTVKAPFCFAGLPVQIQVQPGQTVAGSVSFLPPGTAIPGVAAAGLLLPGAILLGLGLRGQRTLGRVTALALMGLAGVVGLSGLSGCAAGSFNGMTPGIYQYTVSAAFTPTAPGPVSILATTTVSVTVP
jgi:hypothetical protein